jgi:hypothetical protein
LRTAYAAAGQLAEAELILQVESARDNHGRLVTWATDLVSIQEHIESLESLVIR